jgi:hypothetical protein
MFCRDNSFVLDFGLNNNDRKKAIVFPLYERNEGGATPTPLGKWQNV